MEIRNFDATSIPPVQMGDKHPVGNFPFQITDTYGKKNKDTPGGQFVVEFSSPAGKVMNRYNLWNQSQQASEIAHKELSALCHAVGIFKLSFENIPETEYGRELRGGRGTMKVDLQDASKPDGFVEIKKIFDANGNEPGKGPAPSPQPQGQGGWGAPAPQQAPQNNAPANNPAPAGWQQGPSNPPASGGPAGGGAAPPPWAR